MREPNTVLCGDCLSILRTLPDQSVNCCITSPPYWGLRDYGVDGQLGLEKTPDEYVAHMVEVFREVRRVLKNDGTLWLNLGDSYAGSGKASGQSGSATNLGKTKTERTYDVALPTGTPSGLKPKDLVGIPWMVAFALRADGWYLRQDIIWAKPNPMPESVTDRCTKAHEYVFLLSKSAKYYYDAEAIKEDAMPEHFGRYKYDFWPEGTKEAGGSGRPDNASNTSGRKEYDGKRNRRSVWTVTTQPFKEAHFATFPPKLIEPMVLAGCPEGGIILDPFFGAGTTGVVAKMNFRNYIGIELNQKYIEMAQKRIAAAIPNKKLNFK